MREGTILTGKKRAALLLLLAGAGGAYVYTQERGTLSKPDAPVQAALPMQQVEPTEVPATSEPAPSVAVAEPDPVTAEEPKATEELAEETDTAAAEIPEPQETAPSFDVVRIDPDGSALIAGVSRPQMDVAVLLDGIELARAEADVAGKFVSFLDLGRSQRPRVLTLRSLDGESWIDSEDQVIVAPSAPDAEAEAPVIASLPEPQDQATIDGAADDADIARAATVDGQSDPDQTDIATDKGRDTLPAPQAADAAPVIAEVSAPDATAPSRQPAQDVDVALAQPAAPAQQDASALPTYAADTGRDAIPAPDAPDIAVNTEQPGTTAPGASPTIDAGKDPVLAARASGQEPAITRERGAAPAAEELLERPVSGGDAPDRLEAAAESRQARAPKAYTKPTVLLNTRDGVRVLQSAARSDGRPTVKRGLELGAIRYDDAGDIFLSGRGAPGSRVRVYLDNAPVTDFEADRQGLWRGELPGVAPGVYTLRVDQVAQDGSVVERVESPFQREARAVLVAATERAQGQDGQLPVQAITVQPGNTLWAIARDRYGEGIEYVRVFDANRSSIRDPDLIYPGQVFDLPD